jgi:Zn-dependent protease with chaperone function
LSWFLTKRDIIAINSRAFCFHEMCTTLKMNVPQHWCNALCILVWLVFFGNQCIISYSWSDRVSDFQCILIILFLSILGLPIFNNPVYLYASNSCCRWVSWVFRVWCQGGLSIAVQILILNVFISLSLRIWNL